MTEQAHPREIIRVDNLVQTLGDQEILRGFSLKVHQGETLVLLGRSGGGKSVFLRHLIGLMQPISGTVTVGQEIISGLPERELAKVRRSMGMLFQNGALFDSLTVADNVAFPLRERGETDETVVAAKVAEALQMVDLAGQEAKMPVNLSGGMRKRVALARALVSQPRCMLYDEPTAGLDPIVADSIDLLIRRLQRKLGVTSIVVTHDMKSTFTIADHVALLHEGRCYFYGTCDQLRASTDPVIRDFVEGRSHDEP
ncbi:MAG: ATP-binding cassette domain-containing protein [Verrucomicrobia bacterium]|jgi:phospholipid/cholesterol/gamma-HCH transport system ATP-binding protein|nr:ATP-binding cassette domain-containing protein [Verrucomicrobiota bacterium]MDA1203415.1 ATP-binding cassette domain-containing protein [Verrucomicrobiota bacterium]